MNWRDFKHQPEGKKLAKVEKPPASPPLSTFSTLIPAEEFFKNTEQETPLPSWGRAKSYPCGKCGNQTYREIMAGWECENCGATFPFIGGTHGPEIIKKVVNQ